MPHKAGYRAGVPSKEPYTKWEADKDEIEVDYKQMDDSSPPGLTSGVKGRLLKVLALITLFLLGLILGYVIRRSFFQDEMFTGGRCGKPQADYEDYSDDVSKKLSQEISRQNIQNNLRNYTASVHLSGSHDNNLLKHLLVSQLEGAGVKVKTYTYNVLLSYSDYTHPSTVRVLSDNNSVMYETVYSGPQDSHTKYHPEVQFPYSAFSPNGSVQGELVYANHGIDDDFEELRRKNVDCRDKIVIMRYGKIYRGHKVENAEKRGAAAVILYSDPADVTGQYTTEADVWPHTWFLPSWVAQSGAILPDIHGDPLTPSLPSLPGIYRRDRSQVSFPSIPTIPVSYGDAQKIMSHMGGAVGNNDFHGSLADPNVTYSVGPGYTGPRKDWSVSVTVNSQLVQRDITDVVGVIRGETEPDRYILIGCHYDAWGFGAVDPGSGTAILTELARAFSAMVKKGWRPRRTIMFIHWDAEEQGLMGSYEWVQEHAHDLAEKTVTYINLDGIVSGNHTVDVEADPMLRDVLVSVCKRHQSALGGGSVWDQWRKNSPDPLHPDREHLHPVGGGSDQAPFVFLLGVATVWPKYYFDYRKYGFFGYPAYHTMIDTYDYVHRFIDPQFKAHEVMAKVIAELVLQLATRTKLPGNPVLLGNMLGEEYDKLQPVCSTVPELEALQYAIGNFSVAALDFNDQFEQLDLSNSLLVRAYNDRLLRVSRAFIHPDGLPGQPHVRNVLFGVSPDPSMGSVFAGIHGAVSRWTGETRDSVKRQQLYGELQEQISLAAVAVRAAETAVRIDGIL